MPPRTIRRSPVSHSSCRTLEPGSGKERSMLKNLNIGTRLVVSYLVMALLVCATGLTGIHYVSSVGEEGVRVGEEQAPLTDAAMEIKLLSAEAHLKFEEIMSGDEGEDVNQVYAYLD